jgi:hypothetical protein
MKAANALMQMRIAVVVLLGSCLLCRAEDKIAGRWEGAVQIPEREIHVVVDLAQENGGAWSGSATIPSLGVRGAALENISLKETDASFTLKTALADQTSGPAKFTGHLAADGNLMGEFTQGGNTAPFVLEKTGAPQVEQPRRSTAVAPELEAIWKGSYELFGYPRTVTIKLQNRGADGATAEFTIVGKKENKLPVDLVRQEGDFVTIDSHETGLTFEGRAGKEGIKGVILQGPLEIPLTMRRAN